MGEEDAKSVANGNVEMEEKTETVMEKTDEHHDGVTDMEEENEVVEGKTETAMEKTEEHHDRVTEIEEEKNVAEEVENDNMDNEEVSASKETEEKAKDGDSVEEGVKDELTEETKEEEKQQVVDEKVNMANCGPSEKAETDDHKVDDKVDGVGEEEKLEEAKEERALKSCLIIKTRDGTKETGVKQETENKESKTPRQRKTKETKTSMDKKEEQKTPVALTIDRPVRERKSVERLVAIIDQDAAKEFKVEKGRGTALNDIPNVAYKLSRKKTDDTFNLLHTILFGRRGKAAQVKNNISKFSGFTWRDDEEKPTLKLKEKLDKIFKDKLADFCDVLDIPISATIRKEDIISKLIEFLVAPHATTTELLAEKEQLSHQSSKGKKRKRESKSASGSGPLTEGSAKSHKKTKGTQEKDCEPEPENESEEDEETHVEDDKSNGLESSKDEKSNPAELEEKANESKESDKDKRKKKQGSAKSSAKKGTAEKTNTKKVTISKEASLLLKKDSPKSPSSRPKKDKDTSTKISSGKKKDEVIKEKTSTPKKASNTVSPGEKILKVKDNLREEKLKPSDDELRDAVCEILKEVDFNTATFTDILKLLAKRFNKDLVPRKPSIKIMIQDELTKIADAEEADGEKG